jgi:hypothetical protein
MGEAAGTIAIRVTPTMDKRGPGQLMRDRRRQRRRVRSSACGFHGRLRVTRYGTGSQSGMQRGGIHVAS